jgi:hypothetical protein
VTVTQLYINILIVPRSKHTLSRFKKTFNAVQENNLYLFWRAQKYSTRVCGQNVEFSSTNLAINQVTLAEFRSMISQVLHYPLRTYRIKIFLCPAGVVLNGYGRLFLQRWSWPRPQFTHILRTHEATRLPPCTSLWHAQEQLYLQLTYALPTGLYIQLSSSEKCYLLSDFLRPFYLLQLFTHKNCSRYFFPLFKFDTRSSYMPYMSVIQHALHVSYSTMPVAAVIKRTICNRYRVWRTSNNLQQMDRDRYNVGLLFRGFHRRLKITIFPWLKCCHIRDKYLWMVYAVKLYTITVVGSPALQPTNRLRTTPHLAIL